MRAFDEFTGKAEVTRAANTQEIEYKTQILTVIRISDEEGDVSVVVHGRVLDVSNFLSQHSVGELDILFFAVKDASAEFDMFHTLGVIVNFAQDAIIASLGTGGESGCAHESHVSAVAQFASSGVAGRIALKPTRTEGTEWMDTEKLSILSLNLSST